MESQDGVTLVTEGHDALSLQMIYRLVSMGRRVRATVPSATQERMLRGWLESFDSHLIKRVEIVRWNLFLDLAAPLSLERCSALLHNMNAAFRYHGKQSEVGDRSVELLKQCDRSGIEQGVITSSFATVGFGTASREAAYTEEDWSISSGTAADDRIRFRTEAEKKLWAFSDREAKVLRVSVINPVDTCGPVPGDYSTTSQMVRRIVEASLTRLPDLFTGILDVRDLADLHLLALADKAAAGERFIASSTDRWLPLAELATMVHKVAPRMAAGATTKSLPNFFLRLAALGDPDLRTFMRLHDTQKRIKADKAKMLLGWKPRSVEETVSATVESILGSSRRALSFS